MKSKIFTQDEIDKAKEIRSNEDALPGKQRFDSDNRWQGKLGEWAFAELYPQFAQNTQNFKALKFDFITPNSEQLDVKTTAGHYEWSDRFSLTIDYDQYNEGNYQIVVFCYFYSPKREITIIGWNYTKTLDSDPSKTFYGHGEMVLTERGAPRFKVKNQNGIFDWKSSVLRSTEEL